MAVTIPELRNRSALQEALRIPPTKLREVLEFLASVGLVIQNREHFTPGPTQIHLEKGAPGAFQHHTNWHAKALDAVHSEDHESALHYSKCGVMRTRASGLSQSLL